MTADMNIWDDPAILAEIGRQVIALVEKIKEKEKGKEEAKENLPPAPPLRESEEGEGEKKEESSIHPSVSAGVVKRVSLCKRLGIDPLAEPTAEQVHDYAAACNFTDTAWIDKWLDDMFDTYDWCDVTSGKKIAHWPTYFRKQYKKAHCHARKSNPLALSRTEFDEFFAAFWQSYPHGARAAKQQCREKLAVLCRDAKGDPRKLVEDVLTGLDRWKLCDRWNRDEGRFICAPLVWLNQTRWNDRPTAAVSNETPEDVRAQTEAKAAELLKALGL